MAWSIRAVPIEELVELLEVTENIIETKYEQVFTGMVYNTENTQEKPPQN